MVKRRAVSLLLVALLLTGALAAGCSGGEQSPLGASVEEFHLVREEGGRQIVTGVLVNPNEHPIESATITVDLYDQPVEAGVEAVETMRVVVRDIAPGERKPFEQTVDTRRTLSGAKVGRILVF